MYMNSIVYN